MAKNAVVSEDLANKFKTEKETPYTRWVKPKGSTSCHPLPAQSAHRANSKPWARRGGNAVFLNHEASRTSNDCYVMEIPPGKSLNPHRQLFEEMILVLDRPRLDHGVERCRRPHHLRVEGRRALRHSAQLPAPAFQRLGPRAGALRRGDQRAARDQSLRRHRFRLQHANTTSRTASPASPTISAPRASRRASC